MANYGNYGNGGNDSNQRGYATTIKTNPFIKLQGDLDRMVQGSSDQGQSVGVIYENGYLVDGILTRLVKVGDDDVNNGSVKLFSWKDAPVMEDENMSTESLNPVIQANYGAKQYTYEVLAARLEADEEIGYDDDAMIRAVTFDTDDVPEVEGTGPIPLDLLFRDNLDDPDDRFAIWESANNSGPTSSAKATISILSEGGKNNLLSKEKKFGWLNQGTTLRSELEGVTVDYIKISKKSNQPDENGNYRTFYHPIWETMDGNAVMPDNNEYGEATDASEKGETTTAATDGGVAETEADGPVDEFVATCASLKIDTETAILHLLKDMSDDDDYGISEEMVSDTDELVERVQNAVAA